MVASSSSSPFLRISEGDSTNHPYLQQPQPQPQPQPQQQPQQSLSTPPSSSSASTTQSKKKRNLTGAPSKYPDAEVILLSPKTLMATNRFVCEVCNKGFQREQNLQLHRRGHNLPWKLRQKSNKDQVRKKVYLCPEPTCVHHDPARALGDLTGIKKHFSRKHGEKKFKCDKCSKRYAVQSDWKAHAKTCGTREYRCDCGTLFSRRDSFITHRAFCDALAQESARHPATSLATLGSHLFGPSGGGPTTNNMGLGVGLPQLHNPLPSLSNQTTADMLRLQPSHFDHLLSPTSFPPQQSLPPPSVPGFYLTDHQQVDAESHQGGIGGGSSGGFMTNENQATTQGGIFSNKLFTGQLHQLSDLHGSSNHFNLGFYSNNETTTTTNNLNANSNGGFFSGAQMTTSLYSMGPASSTSGGSHMSATALLQKAAQMGSTTSASNASATALLKGFPPSSSSSSSPKPSPPSNAGFGGLFVDQNEQNNLHDLMNSLANNGGPWASQLGDNNNNTITNPNNPAQQGGSGPKAGYNPNKSVMGSSSDGMTRDFLGVGEIVRSINGGFGQQQQGMNNTSASGGATTSSSNNNNNNNQQEFGNESVDHHRGSFQ